MSIRPFLIYVCSITYLVVPIVFFFLGWLRLSVGLPLSLLLFVASYALLKKVKSNVNNEKVIVISKEYWIAFLILFLFLLSTGNTGFLGCWGVDIPWRNAIYQDLIRQPWPVVYDYSQSMLCYYMAFWLVPAEITSLLNLNEFGSNIILFLWMYFGLILILFLLCTILKPKKEHIVLIVILFLFFSGINTFGMIIKSFFIEPAPLITDFPGRDSWSFSDFSVNGIGMILIIRSIFLCIADVYNQFFAIALSTLLFVRFRHYVDFYAFIGLIMLPYSPIGFIGLFVVELLEFLLNAINKRDGKEIGNYIKNSLSIVNIFAVISIIPIFYMYFSMNSHAEVLLTVNTSKASFLSIPFAKIQVGHLIILFFYYYFYFLIYARLIYDSYKKEELYYIILLCLMVFPFFRIGDSADFNFNATICPFIILFILIAKHLLKAISVNQMKVKDLVLVFCLSIAMLTPITQIVTSFRGAYLNDSISHREFALRKAWSSDLLQDSLRDKDAAHLKNFLIKQYENKRFYCFFAKQ